MIVIKETQMKGIIASPLVTNLNGRVYTMEVLSKMRDRINAPDAIPIVGVFPTPTDGKTRIQDMAFQTLPTAKIDNGQLFVDVKLYDTKAGKLLSEFMQGGNYVIVPNGYGSVSDDGIVQDDYILTSLTVTHRD